jgi:hypothetical protein
MEVSICRGVLTLIGVRFAVEKVLLRESLRLLVGVDALNGITKFPLPSPLLFRMSWAQDSWVTSNTRSPKITSLSCGAVLVDCTWAAKSPEVTVAVAVAGASLANLGANLGASWLIPTPDCS